MALPDLFFRAYRRANKLLEEVAMRGVRLCRERPCRCGYCDSLRWLNDCVRAAVSSSELEEEGRPVVFEVPPEIPR